MNDLPIFSAPGQDLESTMPPNYIAKAGQLQTFSLPEQVTGTPADRQIGKAIVNAWRQDGILQIAMDQEQQRVLGEAFIAGKRFFRKPHDEKAACIDSQSYSGYIASGEEITNGIADYSEIFTVTKDLDLTEPRVKAKWPCHGPCPWPDIEMKAPMQSYMDCLGDSGEKLLQLIEYGLELEPGSLTQYTKDGWHHLRILRLVLLNTLWRSTNNANPLATVEILDSQLQTIQMARGMKAVESAPIQITVFW